MTTPSTPATPREAALVRLCEYAYNAGWQDAHGRNPKDENWPKRVAAVLARPQEADDNHCPKCGAEGSWRFGPHPHDQNWSFEHASTKADVCQPQPQPPAVERGAAFEMARQLREMHPSSQIANEAADLINRLAALSQSKRGETIYWVDKNELRKWDEGDTAGSDMVQVVLARPQEAPTDSVGPEPTYEREPKPTSALHLVQVIDENNVEHMIEVPPLVYCEVLRLKLGSRIASNNAEFYANKVCTLEADLAAAEHRLNAILGPQVASSVSSDHPKPDDPETFQNRQVGVGAQEREGREPPSQYRKLVEGDVLQEGDRCWAFECWMPVGESYHGVPVSQCTNKRLCRPIASGGSEVEKGDATSPESVAIPQKLPNQGVSEATVKHLQECAEEDLHATYIYPGECREILRALGLTRNQTK